MNILKQILRNQQVFHEKQQMEANKNNVILTGIPKGEIKIDDVGLTTVNDKFKAILNVNFVI